MKKPNLLAASLLSFTAVVVLAGSAQAAPPTFSELPVGKLTAAPPRAQRPASVGARERVPGLWVVSPKFHRGMPPASRHVLAVADGALAAAIAKDEDGDRRATVACVAQPSRGSFDEFDDDVEPAKRPSEWGPSLESQAPFWPRSSENREAGVDAVHAERLVEAGETASLEAVDAWIDPATRGARMIARSTLPLRLVGKAVGGVRVYAGRDERADGSKRVQFVVVRPPGASARTSQMMALRAGGLGAEATSSCSHLRVSLPVEERGGESVIVLAAVELPPVHAEGEEPKASASPRSAGRAAKGPLRGPDAEGREVRVRGMQIHLSVSRASRDAQPVLAVSFGWAGRERTDRVFEDEPGE